MCTYVDGIDWDVDYHMNIYIQLAHYGKWIPVILYAHTLLSYHTAQHYNAMRSKALLCNAPHYTQYTLH